MTSQAATPLVKAVQDKGDKAALLILDDGSKPVWTPDRETARALLGKPIPTDWTVKEGEYGPQALPPRQKGFGGTPSYRNSKEAFDAEAKSRAAWQAVEEERRDRRTALMQSVAMGPTDRLDVIELAELMYEWLRETSPVIPTVTVPTRSRVAGDTSSGAVADGKPQGTPPSGATVLDPVPDLTPAASGEVAARQGPGEESPAIGASPGSTNKTYPMTPEECDHRARGGYWLKTQVVDGQARCPRCGLSAVMYRETA